MKAIFGLRHGLGWREMLAVTLLSIALLLAGRQRLLRPADELRERYELCDDMAHRASCGIVQAR